MSSGNKKEGISHDTFEGSLDKMVLLHHTVICVYLPETIVASLQFIPATHVHWVLPTCGALLQVLKILQRPKPVLLSARRQKVNEETNKVIPDSTKFVLLVSNERNLVEQ